MHVASVARYPIKSLGGERLATVEVRADGLAASADGVQIRRGDERIDAHDADGWVRAAAIRSTART